jgi:hypothetical protein
MWFDPFKIDFKSEPVANLANTANYQPDIIKPSAEISKISEISSKVVSENKKPDLAKLAELATPPDNQTFVSCGKCLGFQCHNAHGQGSGRCLFGGEYGLWSETLHQCVLFDAVPKHDEWPVNCYTPAGAIIKVWVVDIETAIWLKKSKPTSRIR